MKKLFTIIAVASMMLTTTTVFTSCQKNDPLTEQLEKAKQKRHQEFGMHTEYKENRYTVNTNTVVPTNINKKPNTTVNK